MDAISTKMNYVVKKKVFNFSKGTKNVSLERLLYIESRLHKLEFYIMEDRLNKYSLYGVLNDMEKELEGNDFLRIHQSYLVNMKHIVKVSRFEVLLSNGVKLEMISCKIFFETHSIKEINESHYVVGSLVAVLAKILLFITVLMIIVMIITSGNVENQKQENVFLVIALGLAGINIVVFYLMNKDYYGRFNYGIA